MARHIKFGEIGRTLCGEWGYKRECFPEDLSANPPTALQTEGVLLSKLMFQMAALIDATDRTNHLLDRNNHLLERLPEKMLRAQANVEAKAAIDIAKAEEKAAKARERAANAEYRANMALPPVVIQSGLDLLSDPIRRKF